MHSDRVLHAPKVCTPEKLAYLKRPRPARERRDVRCPRIPLGTPPTRVSWSGLPAQRNGVCSPVCNTPSNSHGYRSKTTPLQNRRGRTRRRTGAQQAQMQIQKARTKASRHGNVLTGDVLGANPGQGVFGTETLASMSMPVRVDHFRNGRFRHDGAADLATTADPRSLLVTASPDGSRCAFVFYDQQVCDSRIDKTNDQQTQGPSPRTNRQCPM
jgi:hypothetical protein